MATEKKAPAKTGSAKKTSAKAAPAKKNAETKPRSRRSVSLPASGKDPRGGLTAEGRKVYNDATGGHLKKGVQGKADTPKKMLRKGSFLRRHFANPPGPVVDAKGEPTRQALEAAAWGEPVPKSEADEKALADKGTELLEQYHASKGEVKAASGRWKRVPEKADSSGRKSTAQPKRAKRTPKES